MTLIPQAEPQIKQLLRYNFYIQEIFRQAHTKSVSRLLPRLISSSGLACKINLQSLCSVAPFSNLQFLVPTQKQRSYLVCNAQPRTWSSTCLTGNTTTSLSNSCQIGVGKRTHAEYVYQELVLLVVVHSSLLVDFVYE